MATLLQTMLLKMLQMMLQTMVLMTMPGKAPAKWIESAMSPTQTQAACGVTTGATREGCSTGRPHRLLLPTAVTRLYFLWWLLLM